MSENIGTWIIYSIFKKRSGVSSNILPALPGKIIYRIIKLKMLSCVIWNNRRSHKEPDSGNEEELLNVPWRDIVGTRDRLTHHYFGVNQEIVWQIVEQDLQIH